MKLLVHLGYRKTGSTAIQTQLAFYRQHLTDSGIALPINPNDLAMQKKGLVSSGNGSSLRQCLLDSLESVVSLLRQDKNIHLASDCILYSSEILFDALCFAKMRSFFLEAIDILGYTEVKLLLFIRNPAAHALSLYGELVKSGRATQTIDEFMRSYRVPQKILNLVRSFNDASSPQLRLSLHNYSMHNNDLLDILWNWLEIPPPTNTPGSSSEEQCLKLPINRSLTRSESELCRYIALAGCNPRPLARALTYDLPIINVDPISPSQESIEALYTTNSSYINQLNNFLPPDEQLPTEAKNEKIHTSSNTEENLFFSPNQLQKAVSFMVNFRKNS